MFSCSPSENLLDGSLGGRADAGGLFQKIGSVIALSFFPFLMVLRHVFDTGLITVLPSTQQKPLVSSYTFLIDIDFYTSTSQG